VTAAAAESKPQHPDVLPHPSGLHQAVAAEARDGLLATPRTLSPWLFYDELGSHLFEEITGLPEYYLTRTERHLFTAHANEILATAAPSNQILTLIELGAGTATKTGILLSAAIHRQGTVLYQPIDVSETALAEADANLQAGIPGLTILPQVANYITSPITIERPPEASILALYIGSSIGNFSPADATGILGNLRSQLLPGDTLLLGADLAPGPNKSVATLLAAYDDAAGVTAAFNRNILTRLNRDLHADFEPSCFAHRALWNAAHSRIEMHLKAQTPQQVHIPANTAGPALTLTFNPSDTIHTENSYKFTPSSIADLLSTASFKTTRTWQDPAGLFAVTLAAAI
jgi:L-histidine N-alpha-methyltransferase